MPSARLDRAGHVLTTDSVRGFEPCPTHGILSEEQTFLRFSNRVNDNSKRLQCRGVTNILGARVERTETYLTILIAGLPAGLSAILLAFGFDPRVVSVTCLALFLWPLYVIYEGPPAKEAPEYGFLRSFRVRLYYAGLFVTIPLNAVIFYYTVGLTPIVAPTLVVIVALLLNVAFLVLERVPTKSINPSSEERVLLHDMTGKVARASVWLSTTILWVDILALVYANSGSVALSLILIGASVYSGFTAVKRELSSRRSATKLSELLSKRRWWRQFESSRGRRWRAGRRT